MDLRTNTLIAFALAAGVVLAGCGSEEPTAPGAEAPASGAPVTAAPSEQNGGTTAVVGGLVEVIGARIPDPGSAARAQLEMTVAVSSPGTPATLTSVSSPDAASVALLKGGHATSRLPVPDGAGTHLDTGPPSPDEILLKGLRKPLRLGDSVPVTLDFGKTSSTLSIPVTTAP